MKLQLAKPSWRGKWPSLTQFLKLDIINWGVNICDNCIVCAEIENVGFARVEMRGKWAENTVAPVQLHMMAASGRANWLNVISARNAP